MRRTTGTAVALSLVLAGGAWAVLRDDTAGPAEACRVRATGAGRFAPFRPADSMGTFGFFVDEANLGAGGAWLEVDSPDRMRRDGSRVRLDSPRRLGGRLATTPHEFEARRGIAEDAESELRDGARVLFLVTEAPGAAFAASLRQDGTAAILGDCVEVYGRSLREFVAKRNATGDGRTPAQIVRAFATDRVLVGALHDHERYGDRTPPWDGAPPARRTIPGHPGRGPEVPATVMAGLTQRTLRFDVPAAWRSFDARFAVFLPDVGWNADTAPFSLDDLSLEAWTSARPFEVWAVPGNGDLTRPLARLAVVQASAGQAEVRLAATVGATSLADLLARARRGQAVLARR